MKKIIDPEKNTILYKFAKNHIVDWKRKRRKGKRGLWIAIIVYPFISLFVFVVLFAVSRALFSFSDKYIWNQIFMSVMAFVILVYLAVGSLWRLYKKCRYVEHYFTQEVLIDGFEVVFTLVFEDGSEQVLVFNVADLKLKAFATKNNADYFLTFITKAKDRMHILHRDDANGWYMEDIKEIHREIKKRIKLARNLPPPK